MPNSSSNIDDAAQKAIWKNKIKTAVQNAGANGAEVTEASVPGGFVAAYTVKLNPAQFKDLLHSYPHVTLGDKRRLYVCVIGDASQPPSYFNENIQDAFLLESKGAHPDPSKSPDQGSSTGGPGDSTDRSHGTGGFELSFEEEDSRVSTERGSY